MSVTETLDRLARGETVEFVWLRNGRDVPDGWLVAEQRTDTHHNDFARLLIKENENG